MRQKGFTQIVLIILLLVVIGGGAYYFGMQKGKVPPNPIQTPSPVTTITPTQSVPTTKPVTDPTANWKTYTTDKYGVSFKYPPSWELTVAKEPDVQNWYDANIVQLISPDVISFDHGEINGGYYLTFGVSKPNPNYSNLQEFLNYAKDQYKYSFAARKINNIDGYLFTEKGKEAGYIFGKGSFFFTINLLTDKDIQTLDQVLSTFQFTQ